MDVLHPCVLQLIPKSTKRKTVRFKGATDFAERCPAIRIFAFGSDPEQVIERAKLAAYEKLGARRLDRFYQYASVFIQEAQWERSFLVEDWSRYDDGRRRVKRYWVHAPTAKLAAWAARAAIDDAIKVLNRSPIQNSINSHLQIPMGDVTVVREYPDPAAVVAPAFEASAFLQAMRWTNMQSLVSIERSGGTLLSDRVACFVAGSPGRDELLEMVRHKPARDTLKLLGSDEIAIARELALEDICDEFAEEFRDDDKFLDDLAPWLQRCHSVLMQPLGENVTDLGVPEPATDDCLRETIDSPFTAEVIHHAGEGL